MDINRLVSYRHFCNKIWNATRYIMTHVNQGVAAVNAHQLVTLERADLDKLFLESPAQFPIQNGNLSLSLIDLWVLSKLGAMVREVNQGFDSLDLSRVTSAIHGFFMYDLCDVYLEFSKLVLNSTQAIDQGATDMSKLGARQVLVTCLNVVLRVMHPLMPYITEELWQRLTHDRDSIVARVYPNAEDSVIAPWTRMPKIEQAVSHLVEIVSAARSLRKGYSLKSDQLTRLIVRTDDPALVSVVQHYTPALQKFCKLSHVIIEAPTATRDESEASSTRLISERCHVIMPAEEGLVDLAQEIAKLEKTHRQLVQRRESLERQMTDVNYAVKVNAEVRAKNSNKLAGLIADLAHVEMSLRQLRAKLK
jgi:valyl-tRNA synthetase